MPKIKKRLELEYQYDTDETRALIVSAHEAKNGPAPEGYVWEARCSYGAATVEAVEPPKPAAEPNDCEA